MCPLILRNEIAALLETHTADQITFFFFYIFLKKLHDKCDYTRKDFVFARLIHQHSTRTRMFFFII